MAAASALSFAVATSALRASSAQQNPCASFPCPSSTLQLRSTQRLASFRPPRCQTEGKSEQQPTQVPVSPAVAPPPPAAPKAPRPAASTGLWDALAFGGPAPERINGRLAMVGFVSALAVELARGDDLLAQLASGGLPWFAGTAALLSVASLVPMLKGVTAQSKSGGLMTSDAEMWNGRFAMLGLLALAFTEYLKGGPLV